MRETEWLDRLRLHDRSATDELLRHYGPFIRYIIAPIVAEPSAREECLNDVSLRVWEKIALFDEAKGGFKSWLSALARNTALNYVRAHASPETRELTEDIPSAAPTPEEALLRQERAAALERALARLSPADRALIYRKYYYRQSTAQIAAELGLTERGVEGRLYRVRKRLQTMLGGEGIG